jgi:integrase
MATIRKRNDRWQAIVKRKGYPLLSKSFGTRGDAEKWARKQEREIDVGEWIDPSEAQARSLAEVLRRYGEEISPTKRGGEIEKVRIQALCRTGFAKHSLAALNRKVISDWKDARLNEVSTSTVARELQFMGHVVAVAIREWNVGLRQNPFSLVRKPPQATPRSRVLNDNERKRLLDACAVCRNHWIKPIVIFALETAARRGEIMALQWSDIDLERRTAHLRVTKTGKARIIPLSVGCVEMLQQLPKSSTGEVFPITVMSLKLAYRRAVARAGIPDFTFHDLRHDALTRLARLGLNILELRAISGHTSTIMLERYVTVDAEELAVKLNDRLPQTKAKVTLYIDENSRV